jgi:hypothetical protein
MGKTKGATDKKPHTCCKSTEAERAAQMAKKAQRKQHQAERERAVEEQ